MSKLIVAGSRGFGDYEKLNKHLKEISFVEIVSGGARGADSLAEKYAKEHNIPLKVFKPNWNKYGSSAGPIRNSEMANYADKLLAFWDGKSKGTKDMIKKAKSKGLEILVIEY